MSNFKNQQDLMLNTFNKFNGEQINSNTKYGFFKFKFDNEDIAREAFEEYNKAGGHSAREKEEITVFIKKEKDSILEDFKKMELKLYALRAAIFIYWSVAIISVLMFCYYFPYNCLAIVAGIVIYSHSERYL